MTNEKKLELTLCGIFPYGLCVCDSLNQIVKVIGVKNQTYFIENGNNYAYADIRDCKPLLHSLDKLTEPVLPNGKVPIEELRKLSGAIEPDEDLKNTFSIIYGKNGTVKGFSALCIHIDQLELFEKLKEWKFNLYSLPKDMYIELSEYDGK